MTVALEQMTITIGCPGTLNGKEGRREVATFYCDLLGMQIVGEGWLKIAKTRQTPLQLALDGDGWSDQRPPRWPDPEHPQQMHLDLGVSDVGSAGELALGLGATLLQDKGQYRTFGDPVGHPFCVYPDPSAGDRPVITRVVFDCFSPRSLAAFYEGFLGTRTRLEDSPERVVIALDDDRYPDFAFQHAQFVAARWPDPAYPAQLHVDYHGFGGDKQAAVERADTLGAIRLPKLADTEIFADPAAHPFCI